MIRFLSVFVVALFVAQVGCDSDDLSAGRYSYTAFGDEDDIIATGSLRLQFKAGDQDSSFNDIEGTWIFSATGGDNEPCHWVGGGRLEGEVIVASGEANIDLNPGAADNNLILTGRFEGDEFAGTWAVNTIAGPICSGRFEAVAR